MGMTGTQRATVLRALMRKEDQALARQRAERERARADAAAAAVGGGGGGKAGDEGNKVLEQVAKDDIDWTSVRPFLSSTSFSLPPPLSFAPHSLTRPRTRPLSQRTLRNPPLPKLNPPLAIWWQQDEAVSGSLDDVRKLVERLKEDTWAGGAMGEGGAGGGGGLLGKLKGWLS